MKNKLVVSLYIIILLSLLLAVSVDFAAVFGWSNGGHSDDPNDPDYGTHDWIAHHALDWLPQKEKQFILDNIANYLYGTELPDRGGIPEGIGDKTKHHVYYYSNGSLQDDVGARRAQEEYDNATRIFKTGNLTSAARRLGVMAHYISDLAVYAICYLTGGYAVGLSFSIDRERR